MKRILALSLTAALSGAALADWVPLGRNEEMRVFLDRAPSSGAPGVVRAWQLYDYTNARWVGNLVIYSVKNLVEYDCKAKRTRTIDGTGYSEPMAGGRAVISESHPDPAWEEVPPESSAEQMLKMACEKR
jgi:hypothetical protein